jgi:glyoxylase-like metal-dependent hydrolase (beta-lactamase superfamily II)
VSVFPTEPEADPLSDWLRSCAKLRKLIPEDVLVLPAHNEPFRGAHRRLEALIEGHETGMRRVLQRLDEPKRAVDLFTALFARAIDKDSFGMATGETIAHLNCLRGRGLVTSIQEGGTMLYRRAA